MLFNKLLVFVLLTLTVAQANLVINEVLPRNGLSIVDQDGSTSDWIELYNSGSQTVSLNGLFLTDNRNNLKKWAFSAGTIPANGYLIVFASGKDRHSPERHTNFNLAKEGGYLALVAADGVRVLSTLEYPHTNSNVTYGKTASTFGYFTTPTPGTRNSSSFYSKITVEPQASHPSGFYESSFALVLTAEPGVTIRYTRDGSDPTADSLVYSTPLSISSTTVLRVRSYKTGEIRSNSKTYSYLFLAAIKTQAINPPPGWPANSAINGQRMDYQMDPEIVNSVDYIKKMDYAFKDIGTVSVVTDLSNLFDVKTGIYVNAGQKGDEWERPASIEFVEKDNAVQINGGIRIRGGYSRSSANPKHSFRLFFSSGYEGGPLHYPLFGKDGTDEFNKMDLRTAQNYSWQFGTTTVRRQTNTIMRDVYSRDLQQEMGWDATKSRYYHLFINGLYWGVYQTQERANQNFAESYMGGMKEDYDILKSTGSTGGYQMEATYGDLEAYNRLWTKATAGFSTDVDYFSCQGLNVDGTVNQSYERLLDVNSLIDCMIILIYCNNWDMVFTNGVNNLFVIFNKNNPDGFKWMCHDFEHSFERGINYDMTGLNASAEKHDFNPFFLHNKLLANVNYKQRFVDRFYKYSHNNGLLTSEKAIERWLSRAAQLQHGIIAESARWGDFREVTPYTKATWVTSVENFKNDYFAGRTPIMNSQVFNRGWFPSNYTSATEFGNPVTFLHYLDEVTMEEVEVSPNYQLKIESMGTMKYTLDGSDPRTPTGGIDPQALSSDYSVQLSISNTTVIQARTYNAGKWSVLRRLKMKVFNDLSAIKISEIQPFPADHRPEFIEIYNDSSEPLNLSGCTFNKGVTLEVNSSTILPANGYAVFTNDLVLFESTYGFPAMAQYEGSLSDGGERLKFRDSLENTIFDFNYRNDSTARIPAMGNGFSLIKPSGGSEINPSETAYWTISAKKLGSPGQPNAGNFDATVVINEIANGSDPSWLEVYNPTTINIALTGWFLTDDISNLSKLELVSGVVDGLGYHVFEQSLMSPSVPLNDFGGEVYLVSPDQRYVHGFMYGAQESGKTSTLKVTNHGVSVLIPGSTPSKGVLNGSQLAGPVVISEIMYHHDDIADYLELVNTSAHAVKLYDAVHLEHCWRVTGINFSFPMNSELAAGEKIVLVRNTVSVGEFRAQLQIPATVRIFNFDGKLSNSGERLTIEKPFFPVPLIDLRSVVAEDPTIYSVFSTVDEVDYLDGIPWPAKADGGGFSMERINLSAPGNDASNWQLSKYKGGSAGFTTTAFNVKVLSGEGDGSYAVGTVVNIEAHEPKLNMVFSHWVGTVTDLNSPTTTLTVGSNDVTVEAIYSPTFSPLSGQIVVNEFMAKNTAEEMEMDNYNFVDWVELKNTTSNLINIGGLCLSNDFQNSKMWPIPSVDIAANGTLVIYLDQTNLGMHANFSLKRKAGSELVLFDSSSQTIDYVKYPQQFTNYAYGRHQTTGAFGYLSEPTLGAPNLSNWFSEAIFTVKPQFSVEPGFYTESQTISITAESGSSIYYTTDGKEPDHSSTLYTGSITITSSSVLRARCFNSARLPSETVTASYLINENAKLPIVSLAIDENLMYDDTLGFYVQGTNGVDGYGPGGSCNYKQPWNRPINLEFFEADGSRGFSTTSEVKIYGGWSRNAAIKSLGIYFDDSVDYPIFRTGSIQKFDSLVLRNGGNDWSGRRLDDMVAQDCVNGFMDLDQQRGRFAMLYINGKFFATMNIREKLNEDFIENHHGIDKDKVDLLEDPNHANPGTTTSYQDLLDYTSKNDVALPGNLDYVDSLVDLKELAHYWMVEAYAGNADWANDTGTRFNNIKWWHSQVVEKAGRWRWMLYDLDGGFSSASGANKYSDGLLSTFPFLHSALQNEEFKTWFVQRASAMTNILFEPTRVEQVVNDLRNGYGLEMQRHIDFWHKSGRTPWWLDPTDSHFVQAFEGYGYESNGYLGTGSYTNWYNDCDNLINFGNARQGYYLDQLRDYFGLSDRKNVSVTVKGAEGGTVSINGVESLQSTLLGSYFSNIPIKLKAEAKKGYLFKGWENASSSFVNVTVFDKLSTWKFHDFYAAPPTTWNGSDFDDSSWISGIGSFGYGDPVTTALKKDDGGQRVNTVYFRKQFSIEDPNDYVSLTLNFRRDDGAVVYLNGTEVARSNMPSGTVSHTTLASIPVGFPDETKYFSFSIDKNLLNLGENVLAVEVHQVHNTSSDITFDAQLVGKRTQSGEASLLYDSKIELQVDTDIILTATFEAIPPVVINEVSAQPQSGSAYQFIEIINHKDVEIDLSNWSFIGINFDFPINTTLSAGEVILIVADSSKWDLGQTQVFQWQGSPLPTLGEISLHNAENSTVSTVSYGNVYLGPGATLELIHPELETSNQANWRKSWYTDGSPGIDNNEKHPIRLSEIYYNASSEQGTDDDYEFIEIVNRGDYRLDLSNYAFTDGVSLKIATDTFINPNEFIVFASNKDSYSGNGYQVIEWESGSLSNKGEEIRFEDHHSRKVFSCDYSSMRPWPVLADGEGYSMVSSNSENQAYDDAFIWTLEDRQFGSPGLENNPFSQGDAVVVNEILSHTDWPQVDFIELYNPTDASVDLSGWFLTDEKDDSKLYALPNGTQISPRGYLVIYEDNDADPDNIAPNAYFGSVFSLSSHGEQVFLISPDRKYSHGFEFGAAANGVTFGRYLNSVADELFPALKSLSPGAVNSDPKIGEVVFSEIMYHPKFGKSEFIEISNNSSETVKFYNDQNPEYSWKIKGVDFTFPPGVELKKGGMIVLIPNTTDVMTFRADYEIDDSVQVFQYPGSLSNDGERLTIQRPDNPDVMPDLSIYVPYITVETVCYNDKTPWPISADGHGNSLVRSYPRAYADDPAQWFASGSQNGSPGFIQLVTLEVINGQGGGRYQSGKLVTISADSIEGATFYQWLDTQNLIPNDNSQTLTFVLHGGDVTVKATFSTVLTWNQPTPITYGELISSSELGATTKVQGSYQYNYQLGDKVNAGNCLLTCDFTPTDLTTFSVAQMNRSLSIVPKSLSVVATSLQAKENTQLPPLVYSYSGFSTGENETDLGGTPSLTTTANINQVGNYPINITQGTLSTSNYDLNFVNGSLFVYENDRSDSVSISLEPGWNLISSPYKGVAVTDYFNPTSFLGSLYFWDTNYSPKGIEETLDPEKGYWIFSMTSDSKALAVNHAPQKEDKFQAGWNLFGVIFNETLDYPVWGWNPLKQVYELEYSLKLGKGYWLFL